MESSSFPLRLVISDSIIEAPDPGTILPVYLQLIFNTEEFLEHFPTEEGTALGYDTELRFGSPSVMRLIIYKYRL